MTEFTRTKKSVEELKNTVTSLEQSLHLPFHPSMWDDFEKAHSTLHLTVMAVVNKLVAKVTETDEHRRTFNAAMVDKILQLASEAGELSSRMEILGQQLQVRRGSSGPGASAELQAAHLR
eukprot:RCo013597